MIRILEVSPEYSATLKSTQRCFFPLHVSAFVRGHSHFIWPTCRWLRWGSWADRTFVILFSVLFMFTQTSQISWQNDRVYNIAAAEDSSTDLPLEDTTCRPSWPLPPPLFWFLALAVKLNLCVLHDPLQCCSPAAVFTVRVNMGLSCNRHGNSPSVVLIWMVSLWGFSEYPNYITWLHSWSVFSAVTFSGCVFSCTHTQVGSACWWCSVREGNVLVQKNNLNLQSATAPLWSAVRHNERPHITQSHKW